MKKIALCLCFCLYLFQASLYSWDKCIVVTTIQYPTSQLRALAKIPGWHLIVAGDKKTPKDWYLENCDYLSPEKQLELGYELAEILPWNHYCRKNIGYLYALENGAQIIYETDDDNEALDGLDPCAYESVLLALATDDTCVNIYDYFGHPEIWPRGFPLDKILNLKQVQINSAYPCLVGVEQGVVNESPDVDAIFRLTQDKVVEFEKQPPCYLPQGVFCPFNSQNTFFHPIAFFSLYLPSFVSMRVSDIWRGYISQRLIWEFNAKLIFSGPNAIQKRNFHSLLHDFLLEQDLYLQSSDLVDFLSNWNKVQSQDPFQLMMSLYEDLVSKGFIQEKELPLLKAWLNDLNRVGYRLMFNELREKTF